MLSSSSSPCWQGWCCFPAIGSSFYVELVAKIPRDVDLRDEPGVLVGFTGLVSLSHTAYFGIAAYTVAIDRAQYGQPTCGSCSRPLVLAAGAAAFVHRAVRAAYQRGIFSW